MKLPWAGLPPLMAAALVVMFGACPGSAFPGDPDPVTGDSQLSAPHIESVHLEPATDPTLQFVGSRWTPLTDADLVFIDTSGNEGVYQVKTYDRDNPDQLVATEELPPVPGSGRTATQVIHRIPAAFPVCVRMYAAGLNQDIGGPDDANASVWSNTVCVDPAVQAARTHVVVWGVEGPDEQDFAQVDGIRFGNRYRVEFSNEGADIKAGTITVDVHAEGNIRLDAPTTWQDGFTCAATPDGFQCTGGKLAHGERRFYSIPLTFTRPGFGHIFAQATVLKNPYEPSAGQPDIDSTNNSANLNINVR